MIMKLSQHIIFLVMICMLLSSCKTMTEALASEMLNTVLENLDNEPENEKKLTRKEKKRKKINDKLDEAYPMKSAYVHQK